MIHCGEGMGRTGTILTYILLKSDLNKGNNDIITTGQCKLGHYRQNKEKTCHKCRKKLHTTLKYLRDFEQKDIPVHGSSTGKGNMSLENESQLALMECLATKAFTNQQLLDRCITMHKGAKG